MRFYLDTNVIYNLAKIPSQLISESIISCLGILELISGIKDEVSFKRRKSAIRKICDSNISVAWELPKTLTERAFSYPIDYSDVDATKKMMAAICHHESFSEVQEARFIIENKEYSLNTFVEYDAWLSEAAVNLFGGAVLGGKFSLDDLGALVRLNHDLTVEKFISSRGEEFRRPSEKYFNALASYMKCQTLEKYIMFISAYSIEHIRLGRMFGKNDGFDMGHVAYMHGIDHFVSNDKIYSGILSKYAGINTLSFEEYLRMA